MLVDDSQAAQEGRMIVRETYVLRNNPATKFADWVAYEVSLAGKTLPDGVAKPKRNWKRDPDLSPDNTLSPTDYLHAHKTLKTDRGHQAPLASFYGYANVQTTNYLSNITPQKSDLNQGPWRILEDKVRDAVDQGTPLHVITGPLYEREMTGLPKASKPHRVPSGYWKVILWDPEPQVVGDEAVAAFIMDQDLPRDADYCATAATVDSVEARSGYNFFPQMRHAGVFEEEPGRLFTALGCPERTARTAALISHITAGSASGR